MQASRCASLLTSPHFASLHLTRALHRPDPTNDTFEGHNISRRHQNTPHHILAAPTMTFASHGQKSKRYAWFLPYKFGLEADDQNASPLFRLPTELRDAIWAYAVTPNTEQCESDRDGGTDAVVHLTSVPSSAPSIALLLTCGRIYNEARKMFRHAQREFWSGNTFMIELSNNLADFRGSKRSHLPNLRKRAVELMPKLIVSVETRKRTYDFHFVDEGQLSRGHRC